MWIEESNRLILLQDWSLTYGKLTNEALVTPTLVMFQLQTNRRQVFLITVKVHYNKQIYSQKSWLAGDCLPMRERYAVSVVSFTFSFMHNFSHCCLACNIVQWCLDVILLCDENQETVEDCSDVMFKLHIKILYTGWETNACPLASASENLAGRVENRPGRVEFCIGYIRDYPVWASAKKF